MNILPRDKQIQIVAALTEGCSIRSVERLTDTHRDSVMRLGVRVGEGCARLHDAMMRGLHVNILELDEQWSFIQKKAKRVQPGDNPEAGDCYLHIALDATSKAVVAYTVGNRSHEYTMALAADLRARIVNRPQITSDGWRAYPDAIEQAFGTDVDFATIVKDYTTTPGNEAAVRYSPGKIRSCQKTIVSGNPDRARNRADRMRCGRFD